MSVINLESIVKVEDIHPYRLNGAKQCLENIVLFWKILCSYYGPQFVKKPQFIRKMYMMAMLIRREYENHMNNMKSKVPEASTFSTEDFLRGFVQMLDFNGGRMMFNLWSEAGTIDREGIPQSWELHPFFVYALTFRFLIVLSGNSKSRTLRLKFCPVCCRFLPQDTLVCFKAVKGDSPEYIIGHNDIVLSKLLEDQNDLRLRWNAMTPSLFLLPAHAKTAVEDLSPLPTPPKKSIEKKVTLPAKKPAAVKCIKTPAVLPVLKTVVVSDFPLKEMNFAANTEKSSSTTSSSSESSSESSEDDDLHEEIAFFKKADIILPPPKQVEIIVPPLKQQQEEKKVIPQVRQKRKYVRRLHTLGEPIRNVPQTVRRMANPFLNTPNMEVAASIMQERILNHSNTFDRVFYNPLINAFGETIEPRFDSTVNVMYYTYREKYHIFIANDKCVEECCTKWYVMMGKGTFRNFTSFGQFSLADVMKSAIDQEELRFIQSGGKPNTEPPIPTTVHNVFRHLSSEIADMKQQQQRSVIHDDGLEEDEELFNEYSDNEDEKRDQFFMNQAMESIEMIDPYTGDVVFHNKVPAAF